MSRCNRITRETSDEIGVIVNDVRRSNPECRTTSLRFRRDVPIRIHRRHSTRLPRGVHFEKESGELGCGDDNRYDQLQKILITAKLHPGRGEHQIWSKYEDAGTSSYFQS